jgi:hypothetical protein
VNDGLDLGLRSRLLCVALSALGVGVQERLWQMDGVVRLWVVAYLRLKRMVKVCIAERKRTSEAKAGYDL